MSGEKLRFSQATTQVCDGKVQVGLGSLLRMETWTARFLVEDELGTREELLGLEERCAGSGGGGKGKPRPQLTARNSVIRAQSAKEKHTVEGHGGVCPEHGPLGAQAGLRAFRQRRREGCNPSKHGPNTRTSTAAHQIHTSRTCGLRARAMECGPLRGSPGGSEHSDPDCWSQAPAPGLGLRHGISLRIF